MPFVRSQSNDPLSTTIEAIYLAATDPAGWPDALALIGALVGAQAVTLISADRSDSHDIFAFHNMDPAQIALYNRDFQGEDPTVVYSLSQPVGTFVSSADMFSDDAWRNTRLYHELIRHDGMFYLEGSTLFLGSGAYSALGYHRSHRAGPASGEARRLHDEVARHLRRALGVHRRLQQAEAKTNDLREVLERLVAGVLLIDHCGRVVFANASARRMLERGDGLRLQEKRPVALHRDDAAKLNRLLANAVLPADRALGGSVALRRAGALPPIQALVVPLRRAGSSAAIFLGEPLGPRPQQAVILQHLYGLTPTEAKVAVDLAAGHPLPAIADRVGVKVATVRSHLKGALAKTATHRQSELVSLILRSPLTMVEPTGDPSG